MGGGAVLPRHYDAWVHKVGAKHKQDHRRGEARVGDVELRLVRQHRLRAVE
jgi:hypothetical protein